MSYDNPIPITFSFNAIDLGDETDVTRAIKGPSGMRGRIDSVCYGVTETVDDGTGNAASLLIGVSDDADAYLDHTIVDGQAASTSVDISGVNASFNAVVIPANTTLLVKAVAIDSNDAAGTIDLHIQTAWY